MCRSGIKADARNSHFYFKRKATLTGWEDEGLADFRVHGGQGLTIDAVFEPLPLGKHIDQFRHNQFDSHIFCIWIERGVKVVEASCLLEDFDLSFHDTQNHGQWMYTMAAPVVRSIVKSKVQSAVVDWLISLDVNSPS